VLSPHDVVVPDVLFVSVARAGVVGPAHAAGAPDLVVEVLSPSTHRRDELLKRDAYEKAGVEEYWIVDSEGETVKVLRRDGPGFGRPRLLSARDGDGLATPLLPGLELPLAALFGD
jgi:Uma2 family endonuclease